MASIAAEFHLDTAVRQVADGIAKILEDGDESVEMNFLVDLCDLSKNICDFEQRLKRSERNNLFNLGANLFNACQISKDRTTNNNKIVTAKLACYCLSCQQLDVPLVVQLMGGWAQTGIDASAGGVHFSPDAKECFYQACDLFFNKLTLEEAPRVIPGAKLDQTYQIAFNACSGLVKADLDMLASSCSQENVNKHEESIQSTVFWLFELQRFMQPLETSQNEIELALLLGKVGIVMKHLDLLNHAVRYLKQAVQASGLIRSSKVDAKSFKIKAIHNLAECHLQIDPKECLITLGMMCDSKDEPYTLKLKCIALFLQGEFQDGINCFSELLEIQPLPPCNILLHALETLVQSALRIKQNDIAKKLLLFYPRMRNMYLDPAISLSWMKQVEHDVLSIFSTDVAQETSKDIVAGKLEFAPAQLKSHIDVIMRLLSKAHQEGRWDEIVRLVSGSVMTLFQDDRKSHSESFRVLATAHIKLGNLDEALKCAEEGVKIYPSSAAAYIHYECTIRQPQKSNLEIQVRASVAQMMDSRDFHCEYLAAAAAESMKLGRKQYARYCLECIATHVSVMLESGDSNDVALQLQPLYMGPVLRSLLMLQVSIQNTMELDEEQLVCANELSMRALQFLKIFRNGFSNNMVEEVKWWVAVLTSIGSEIYKGRANYIEAMAWFLLAIAFLEDGGRSQTEIEMERLYNLYLRCLLCQLQSQILNDDTNYYLSQCRKICVGLKDETNSRTKVVAKGRDVYSPVLSLHIAIDLTPPMNLCHEIVSFHVYCMQNQREALKAFFAEVKQKSYLDDTDFKVFILQECSRILKRIDLFTFSRILPFWQKNQEMSKLPKRVLSMPFNF